MAKKQRQRRQGSAAAVPAPVRAARRLSSRAAALGHPSPVVLPAAAVADAAAAFVEDLVGLPALCALADAAVKQFEVLPSDTLAALEAAAAAMDVGAEERAWLRGWLAGERAATSGCVTGLAELAGDSDGRAAAAAVLALSRHRDCLGLLVDVPAVCRAALRGPEGLLTAGPLLTMAATTGRDDLLIAFLEMAPLPAAPAATVVAVAGCRTVGSPWVDAEAVFVDDDGDFTVPEDLDLDDVEEVLDDDFVDSGLAAVLRLLPLPTAEALAATSVRWASWLREQGRKARPRGSTWQEPWRAAEVALLARDVGAQVAHRYLGQDPVRAGEILEGLPARGARVDLLRVLAGLGVVDANQIVVPVTDAARLELVERILSQLEAPPAAHERGADWVHRQMLVVVGVVGLCSGDARLVMESWMAAQRTIGSAPLLSYCLAVAVACLEDGPLLRDGVPEPHRDRYKISAATSLVHALANEVVGRADEMVATAGAAGVDIAAVGTWTRTLADATKVAAAVGDAETLVVLATNPQALLTDAPPAALAAISGQLGPAWRYLATLLADDVDVDVQGMVGSFDELVNQVLRNDPDDDDDRRLVLDVTAGLLATLDVARVIDAAVEAAEELRFTERPRETPPALDASAVALVAEPALDVAPLSSLPAWAADPVEAAVVTMERFPGVAMLCRIADLVGSGAEVPGPVAERLSATVSAAGSRRLDAAWAELVTQAKLLFNGGPRRSFELAEVLVRLGRADEAAAVFAPVLGRAARSGIPGVASARVEELAAMFGTVSAADVEDVGRVRVVFCGGNEIQARAVGEVEATLADRHGDRVEVTWVHPGWSSNWVPAAERVVAALEDADVLVLMRFVRTNLGGFLRRAADEAALPWVACTGHGRASMLAAVEEAVAVVDARRAVPEAS